MPRIAAIGELLRIQGFGLAGAVVCAADSPVEVRAAWDGLPVDVTVVVLTPPAAAALADVTRPSARLTVVMSP
jgi:hypothetical protein